MVLTPPTPPRTAILFPYPPLFRPLLAVRPGHGRCGRAAWLLRWSAGTDADEPGAAHLRHLRNIGGPRWLIGLSAATLDDAARRFAGNVDPVLIDIFMENASGFACGASASVGIAPASAAHSLAIAIEQIGRASCRERVCSKCRSRCAPDP